MYNHVDRLEALKSNSAGYWADRILSELTYAVKLSRVSDGEYDPVIAGAVRMLDERQAEEGAISKSAAQQAEDMILGLSEAAKAYRVLCVAHAHIDMNWMWGYAETSAIALDTFRTMLNLMKEYPDFKFSQSQASVYRIVEEFDPKMLEEIKVRVGEGRWEVSASTWVEADKNMPNGESFARHILYTKRYLSKLLDINPDSLQLDFEPDTFGHSRNIPEILSMGGVKYYYHCRGYDGHNIYRWKSPSGSSVIVYREPLGYNAAIGPDVAVMVPEFCKKHGLTTMLKVYGVGDHGGGPTRRDVERIIEMDSWPVFPRLQFSTYAEYFSAVEEVASGLPVVDEELNFVFSGCYTTQTRIKLSNRIGEARLYDAEAFGALSALFAGGDYPGGTYEEAWRKVLFNQFHDILTGSGVIETREYAMGQFQQVLTAANTGYIRSLRNIASQIDTSSLPEPDEDCNLTISEGAGSGFSVTDYGIPQAERGRGKLRIFHLFNPSAHDRTEPVEITVWDWPGDVKRMEFRDGQGNPMKHQIISGNAQQLHPAGAFWGHKYIKLLLEATAPALGYCTCTLRESPLDDLPGPAEGYPRVEKPDEFVLDNGRIRAVFDTGSVTICSLTDLAAGVEYVDPALPAGVFRLIDEDTARGMTSWIVGRHMGMRDLNRDVRVTDSSIGPDQLRQWISYSVSFGNSRLDVTVSLDRGSSRLDYAVECDWQEMAKRNVSIPQLNFHMPFTYRCGAYRYDVPFGAVERSPLDMDVPGNSWALAVPEDGEGRALRIMTNTKYGFRGWHNSLSLTLIRSSYDPDPYPEHGIQKFRFAVELAGLDNDSLINGAFDYNHPVGFVSEPRHTGTLPMGRSFLALLGGSVAVSAVKAPEDGGSRLIARVYETNGSDTVAVFRLGAKAANAWFVDLNENSLGSAGIRVEGDLVNVEVKANSVASICMEF